MVKTKIQIRFSDCDMMNHVNNAIYLQYFEMARMHFFNQDLPNWDWQSRGIILAKNTIEYKQPVFLKDNCIVEVNCIHIGTTSFTLSYHLSSNQNNKLVLKTYGESVLVCYDFTKNERISIPKSILTTLKNNFVKL